MPVGWWAPPGTKAHCAAGQPLVYRSKGLPAIPEIRSLCIWSPVLVEKAGRVCQLCWVLVVEAWRSVSVRMAGADCAECARQCWR